MELASLGGRALGLFYLVRAVMALRVGCCERTWTVMPDPAQRSDEGRPSFLGVGHPRQEMLPGPPHSLGNGSFWGYS